MSDVWKESHREVVEGPARGAGAKVQFEMNNEWLFFI